MLPLSKPSFTAFSSNQITAHPFLPITPTSALEAVHRLTLAPSAQQSDLTHIT